MDRVLPERPLFRARLDAAGQRLAALDAEAQAPPLRAVHELIVAGLAIRRLQTQSAREALTRAAAAATLARIPALIAEVNRSDEHTSELQSLMRISYAVFCLKNTNSRYLPLTI